MASAAVETETKHLETIDEKTDETFDRPPMVLYSDLCTANFQMLNPKYLSIYKTLPQIKKLRIGRDNDGGYVCCQLPVNYNLLISCGIADDISFEEQFVSKYNCTCVAFDGTIGGLPNPNSPINWVKKNIGITNDANTTNLTNYIDDYIKHFQCALPNIFLKMDIEGHEIAWINSIDEKYFEYFQQIIIEFHWPFTPEAAAAIKKLNKYFMLAHLHGNNACGMRTFANVNFPNVFECTWIKSAYSMNSYSTEPVPGPLDMPNLPHMEDLNLNHKPFKYGKQE